MIPLFFGLRAAAGTIELLTFANYGLTSLETVTAGSQISPDYQDVLRNAGANKLATVKGVFTTEWAAFTGIETTSPVTLVTGETLQRPSTSTYVDGALFQPAATNLWLQSQEFDASWTAAELTVDDQAATAPDGTTTADLIIPSTNSAEHRLYLDVATTAGVYTASVYAKQGGYKYFGFTVYDGGADYIVRRCVDLNTGLEHPISDQAGTLRIVSLPDGRYRLSFTATYTGDFAPPFSAFRVYSTAPAAFNTFTTGDGASGIYLWGAQLETGSVATTYIPTTTATVTRNATVVTVPATMRLANNGIGIRAILTPREIGRVMWLYSSDGTYGLGIDAAGKFFWKNNATTITGTTVLSVGTEYKVGVAMTADGATLYVNETSEATTATGTDLAWASSNQYVGSHSGTTEFLHGVMQLETALLSNVPATWAEGSFR